FVRVAGTSLSNPTFEKHTSVVKAEAGLFTKGRDLFGHQAMRDRSLKQRQHQGVKLFGLERPHRPRVRPQSTSTRALRGAQDLTQGAATAAAHDQVFVSETCLVT